LKQFISFQNSSSYPQLPTIQMILKYFPIDILFIDISTKLQLNITHKTIVMGLINVYLLYFNTKRTTYCVQLRLLEMLWLVNGIFKMKLVPCEIWSNFLFSWLSDFLHHIHQLIYLPVYHCTNDFYFFFSWYFFISSNSLLCVWEMCCFFFRFYIGMIYVELLSCNFIRFLIYDVSKRMFKVVVTGGFLWIGGWLKVWGIGCEILTTQIKEVIKIWEVYWNLLNYCCEFWYLHRNW
jgi:hypothetical protein